MNALVTAHDAAVPMIDKSIVRVHQHVVCIARNRRQSGRSRRGQTSMADSSGLPVRLALTTGEAHDNRLAAKLLSHLNWLSGYDGDWIRTQR
jgi:hypothetical protein